MKVVTPFRPFAPESGSHLKLGPFDWVGAIGLLRASVHRACRCECYALTDVDAVGPLGPTYAYQTYERRLMLWLLEVVLCYLRSDAFDEDTVLVSPDALVLCDLRGLFRADLGLMVRTRSKYADKPLLNGVQVWRVGAKDRLVALYEQAIDMARIGDPRLLKWGADTAPLVELLGPLQAGSFARQRLSIYGFEAGRYFRPVPVDDLAAWGWRGALPTWVVDFKGATRKHQMVAAAAALQLEAVAC